MVHAPAPRLLTHATSPTPTPPRPRSAIRRPRTGRDRPSPSPAPSRIHAPRTLHPATRTLRPTPCTLHPAPPFRRTWMPSGSVRSSMSSATRPSSLPETAALLAPQRATLASWGWLSLALPAPRCCATHPARAAQPPRAQWEGGCGAAGGLTKVADSAAFQTHRPMSRSPSSFSTRATATAAAARRTWLLAAASWICRKHLGPPSSTRESEGAQEGEGDCSSRWGGGRRRRRRRRVLVCVWGGVSVEGGGCVDGSYLIR